MPIWFYIVFQRWSVCEKLPIDQDSFVTLLCACDLFFLFELIDLIIMFYRRKRNAYFSNKIRNHAAGHIESSLSLFTFHFTLQIDGHAHVAQKVHVAKHLLDECIVSGWMYLVISNRLFDQSSPVAIATNSDYYDQIQVPLQYVAFFVMVGSHCTLVRWFVRLRWYFLFFLCDEFRMLSVQICSQSFGFFFQFPSYIVNSQICFVIICIYDALEFHYFYRWRSWWHWHSS